MENGNEEIAVYHLRLKKLSNPAIIGTALISDDLDKIVRYYNAYLDPHEHHSGKILYFKDGGRLKIYLPLTEEDLDNLIREDGEPGIYVKKMTRSDYSRMKEQILTIKGRFI